MSKQGCLGISGVFLLASIFLGGHIHASTCNLPPSEVLDMQLERVTYDGVPVNPPEYAGLTARLHADFRGFWLQYFKQPGGVVSVEPFHVE